MTLLAYRQEIVVLFFQVHLGCVGKCRSTRCLLALVRELDHVQQYVAERLYPRLSIHLNTVATKDENAQCTMKIAKTNHSGRNDTNQPNDECGSIVVVLKNSIVPYTP